MHQDGLREKNFHEIYRDDVDEDEEPEFEFGPGEANIYWNEFVVKAINGTREDLPELLLHEQQTEDNLDPGQLKKPGNWKVALAPFFKAYSTMVSHLYQAEVGKEPKPKRREKACVARCGVFRQIFEGQQARH